MPFIDARDLPRDSEIVADVVVIGAGMAGLAIAREWAGSGHSIALIESGDRAFDPKVQDLYAGQGVVRGPGNPDRPFDRYLTDSRRRMLGGAGNLWGGKCVALDPADFAERSWVPGSGWPLSRAAIQTYYDRTCDLLEIPHFPPGETAPDLPGKPELKIGDRSQFFSAPRQFTRYSGAVDPKAFDRFRTAPAAAANVTIYLNANVTELKLAPDRRSIQRLNVACLNGARHTARGRAYVLAVGGIENARLLLASNSVDPKGVGNDADLVGRYFQGHQVYAVYQAAKGRTSGVYMSGTDHDMSLYTSAGAGQSHCVFAPTLAGQRARRDGNATITLNLGTGTPAADPEIIALQQLTAGVDRGQSDARTGRDISCFLMAEHHPNPDSRVSLGSGADALGMPRVKLEWTYSEADWRTLEGTVNAFGRALGEAGLGRLVFPIDRSQFLAVSNASRHHMGTTRMNRDPAKGVVDINSRVHGVSNLYVAGSSIFPTSGIGNPTLTLLAYALRLSDHLKTELAA